MIKVKIEEQENRVHAFRFTIFLCPIRTREIADIRLLDELCRIA